MINIKVLKIEKDRSSKAATPEPLTRYKNLKKELEEFTQSEMDKAQNVLEKKFGKSVNDFSAEENIKLKTKWASLMGSGPVAAKIKDLKRI